ncbi:MAG: ABC transporter ATP-binding protein [Planctomycetota bacterium]|nr:MAG: ABC transporter ATP-binding protein [Planctomycetota bacterium]
MSSDPGGPAAGAPVVASVVAVEGLEKAYGPVRAVCGVSFHVPAGEVVGFLGRNGAGKTTVLRILTGYLGADAGSVRVCGFDVEAEPLAVKERVGYLPENNPLYPEQRVGDFLHFAARARGLRGPARHAAVDRAVLATGLESVYRRPIGECSKGYRQRVGLAQALLHDPPLLILDEPTSGLDPMQASGIRELIRSLGRTKTVILTSHVLPEVEALAQRVLILHRGRMVADAPLAELRQAQVRHAVRVCARVPAEALEELLRAAGVRELVRRASAFGDGVAALEGQVQAGPEALERIGGEALARGIALLELAPQRASLEALFQRLVGEDAA